MIGIVVVTHSQLGEALIEAAEFIVGSRPEGVVSVSIDLNQNVDKLREKVAAGIKKAGREEGILLLTDMFGGTPSNISYSFLEEGRVEVLSGVNLPILVQALVAGLAGPGRGRALRPYSALSLSSCALIRAGSSLRRMRAT